MKRTFIGWGGVLVACGLFGLQAAAEPPSRKAKADDILIGTPPELALDSDGAGDVLLDPAPTQRLNEVSESIFPPKKPVDSTPRVMLAAVETDRIRYQPGETGEVTVVFSNTTDQAATADFSVDLLWGLDQTQRLHAGSITILPRSPAAWTGRFETAGRYWGGEVQATACVGQLSLGVASAVFGVTTNFWEIALTGLFNALRDSCDDMDKARLRAKSMMAQGYTAFECAFWAPCDMIDFTPDHEWFHSGQCGYPATITTTRNLIAAAHERGISAAVYANLWGAAGPSGMELMRQHPDWFGQATFETYMLDDWSLLDDGKMMGPLGYVWIHNQINLGGNNRVDLRDQLYDLHSQELIASHKMFGWDATRYDSYYSNPWTIYASRRVRQKVEEAIPGYQWGYNSLTIVDRNRQALDVMVGGGGMIVEEALGYAGPDLGGFANVLIPFCQIIWPFNGHLSVTFASDSPRDAAYRSAILLAAGAHPFYSTLGEFHGFALRYSEFLWNNRMRPLKAPDQVVDFGDRQADLFRWKQLARTVTVAGNRRRLVINLINLPDQRSVVAKERKPIEGLQVGVRLPSDAQPRGVWALTAIPKAQHQAIPFQFREGRLTAEIPSIEYWTVVVLEYDAGQGLEEKDREKMIWEYQE